MAERVFVVHQGLLGQMIIGSQGLITVNSTVGLRAVIFSRPVLALGQAVWDVAGLAHQGSIDSFWSEGAPPDPTLREAFLRALQGVTQLRGLFYGTEGRKAAVAGTVARLHADTVGVPDALSPTQTGEAARDFDDV